VGRVRVGMGFSCCKPENLPHPPPNLPLGRGGTKAAKSKPDTGVLFWVIDPYYLLHDYLNFRD